MSTGPDPLSPGDVRIGGELQQRVHRNFDRMEQSDYQPPKVHSDESQWPGDMEGRTVLALTLLARAAHRNPRYLDQILSLFPKWMNARGFFGPIYSDGSINEQQLSGHGWVLRGLCEHYQWTHDERSLAMLQKIVENLVLPTAGAHESYPIDPSQRQHAGKYEGSIIAQKGRWILSTDTGCDFIFLDGVIHAYDVLHIPALAEIIDEMIERYLQIDLVAIKAQTHASLTGMRGLLRYASLTGSTDLVRAAQERYRLYTSYGMSETYANWNWFGRPMWTEPCAIIDAFMLAVQLWQLTGNAQYLEGAHLMYFNAMGHGQRYNGGFGCDTCAGVEPVAQADGSHVLAFSPFLKISTPEAWWCCTMRGGEGLSRAVEYSYFHSPDSLVLPFFHESETVVPLAGRAIRLGQTTGYPYQGWTQLEVLDGDSSGEALWLRLFAPSWTRSHSLTRNGQPLEMAVADGFASARVPLVRGDVLRLTFSQKIGAAAPINQTLPPLQGYHTLRHGPLILGTETKDEIRLGDDVELMPAASGQWRVKGQDTAFAAINDLLHREVSQETYCRQVLFC